MCIFRSVMVWAWCSVAEGDSWMIWGEEQTNPSQSAGAAQGWRMELIAKYLQVCSGHYPSQPQRANLGHSVCYRNNSDHHRFKPEAEAVLGSAVTQRKGVEKCHQAWWQLLSWYSGWTSSTGVDPAWARGTADTWQCWKHSCPNPSQACSLSQIINKPDNAEGRIDR